MGQIQGMVSREKNQKHSLFLQKNCNPKFLKTIGFGDINGVDTSTRVRLTVYNVKERMTGTVSTHFHQVLGALSFFRVFSSSSVKTLKSPTLFLGQCPLLSPSVCGLQMVWECVCDSVCVCGRNELNVYTTLAYPHISSFCAIHKHTHTHMHPQTI